MSEYEYITAYGYKPPKTHDRIIREEIVRCRDCLNYVEGLITDDNEREPSYCCQWKREYIRGEGFCSYAERMK